MPWRAPCTSQRGRKKMSAFDMFGGGLYIRTNTYHLNYVAIPQQEMTRATTIEDLALGNILYLRMLSILSLPEVRLI